MQKHVRVHGDQHQIMERLRLIVVLRQALIPLNLIHEGELLRVLVIPLFHSLVG
jgi:hypothetical protein